MTSRDLLRAIDRFLFAPYSPYPLSIFRILLGLLMLDTVLLHLLDDFFLYYGPHAMLPAESLAKHWWRFEPVLDMLVLLPSTGEATVGFFIVFCVVAFFVTVGLFTPYAVPIAFLMLLSIHRQCPFNINGGDAMMLLSLFLLSFGRSGDALSFDNLIKSLRQDWRHTGFSPPLAPAWPLRMLQLQLSLAYLDTFLWKFTGTKWLDGSAVYWATRMHEFIRFPLPSFLDNPVCLRILSWSTLVIEFSLATLIWFKETRYAVIAAGFLLHLGIDSFINLPVFEWVFISMLVLFIYPEDLSKCATWIRQQIASRFGPPHLLSFDGNCKLCVRSIGFLHRLDIFRRLDLVDFTDEKQHSRLNDFDISRAQTEMMLSTNEGWVGGFRAFRRIAVSLPFLWLLLPLLYFPGMTVIGDHLYKLIAKDRYLILGRCDDGYCDLRRNAGDHGGAR
ncbi:MAG TPA: DUF393 domain-containing protein [Candidatus Melainabacteria bacterium]|nr:DUF393 domain-containing protein [Candidatus Melainabacteria bacterium]HIN64603.1 DUF393 domain-containing protein [Candidatus Obscuribacterales bacterium]